MFYTYCKETLSFKKVTPKRKHGVIIGSLFYSLIGGLVAVLVERPKFKWLDDDLLMQIFPVLIMTIFYVSGLGPDLPVSLGSD